SACRSRPRRVASRDIINLAPYRAAARAASRLTSQQNHPDNSRGPRSSLSAPVKDYAMSSKLLAVAAGLLFAGTAWAQTGQVEVKDAWARATPAGAQNGAAYLTIVSPTSDKVTGVST